MIAELEDYNWKNAFGEDCITLRYDRTITYRNDESLSVEPFTREDVETLLHSAEGEHDGASWLAVGKLKDGRYFSIEAGCDYTGWDCQAGGSCSFSKTYEDVLKFGVEESDFERLGIKNETNS